MGRNMVTKLTNKAAKTEKLEFLRKGCVMGSANVQANIRNDANLRPPSSRSHFLQYLQA